MVSGISLWPSICAYIFMFLCHADFSHKHKSHAAPFLSLERYTRRLFPDSEFDYGAPDDPCPIALGWHLRSNCTPCALCLVDGVRPRSQRAHNPS